MSGINVEGERTNSALDNNFGGNDVFNFGAMGVGNPYLENKAKAESQQLLIAAGFVAVVTVGFFAFRKG